ncbi:MAG: selenoneine biosynthesis selenosugar synthase SenB [Burkholderiales bacterium]
MKIALAVPASADMRSGNWRSAKRWERMLRSLGHRVRSVTDWTTGDEDVLVALHARKSHSSVARFRERRPQCPVVVVLTGTDVYRDIRSDAHAQASLEMADRLVVLQARALDELAPALRRKATMVHQSCTTKLRHTPPRSKFRVCVVAHLREEKDPFRAARALVHVPRAGAVELVQIGEALDERMQAEALAWQSRDDRYRWLGSVPHARALCWMAQSHALVVSSLMEGGANVISEAVSIGVPVLASNIPGNVGMLGGRYRGYFETGDEKALARLIEHCRTDAAYYRALRSAVTEKRSLFSAKAEAGAWKRVLSSL